MDTRHIVVPSFLALAGGVLDAVRVTADVGRSR